MAIPQATETRVIDVNADDVPEEVAPFAALLLLINKRATHPDSQEVLIEGAPPRTIHDGLTPIVFRTDWPEEALSRHTVLYLRPEISRLEFGRKIDSAFGIAKAGARIKAINVVWKNETISSVMFDTFKTVVGVLGKDCNGIIEVFVEPKKDSVGEAECWNCGQVVTWDGEGRHIVDRSARINRSLAATNGESSTASRTLRRELQDE